MRARAIVSGLITGFLFVGSVWAAAGLTPVTGVTDTDNVLGNGRPTAAGHGTVPPGECTDLAADEACVGAAKVTIAPDENLGYWEKDPDKCLPPNEDDFDFEEFQEEVDDHATHAADFRNPWIENNNCIYMGGFGIGPSQPALSFDTEYGLWSRSVAISDGTKTVVITILDGEGYFADYNNMCGPVSDCGTAALATELGATHSAAYGTDSTSFIFASTHAHSAMDFIGGWGGVPEWYMRQVADAMRTSVGNALANMVPAKLYGGETLTRKSNGERRDLYWSAEDPTVNWLQAVDRNHNVVATVGAFAAHATSFGSRATVAHADWPGVFDKTVENAFGGVGLMFEGGLGNMSTRGGHMMGKTIGDAVIADIDSGTLVPKPNVRIAQAFWAQPVTNVPLGTLGAGGFFDRPFDGPASVQAGKSADKKCTSAGPTSALVSVSAIRIGDAANPGAADFLITAAPGEIFSNYSNTIEERARVGTLAIGQANDALGYMPQSFESDMAAREGPGFAGNDVGYGPYDIDGDETNGETIAEGEIGTDYFEYEDAYSIDLCFGDKALESTLNLISDLRS